MDAIVGYMIEQYKESHHIPTPEELLKEFPRASWMDIINAGYEFDAWHDVWTSERV